MFRYLFFKLSWWYWNIWDDYLSTSAEGSFLVVIEDYQGYWNNWYLQHRLDYMQVNLQLKVNCTSNVAVQNPAGTVNTNCSNVPEYLQWRPKKNLLQKWTNNPAGRFNIIMIAWKITFSFFCPVVEPLTVQLRYQKSFPKDK